MNVGEESLRPEAENQETIEKTELADGNKAEGSLTGKVDLDWWARADIVSKFLSSVVIAVVGIAITFSIQQSQLNATRTIADAQLEAAKTKARDDKKIEEGRLTAQLVEHLTSKDAARREIAVVALRESVPDSTYEKIVGILAQKDESEDVRKVAIAQLGDSSNQDIAATLNKISQDKRRSEPERNLAIRSTQEIALKTVLANDTFAFGASGDVAYESSDLGHGVFTYYLLKGLGGGADPEGTNVITADGLKRYLLDTVTNYSRKTLSPSVAKDNSVVSRDIRFMSKSEKGQVPVAAFAGNGSETIWGNNTRYSRIFGVIVGVSDYVDSKIMSLPFTKNDAQEMADTLRKDKRSVVTLLLNPGKTKVLAAVSELRDQIKETDLLVVYFACHGILGEDGSGKLIVADSRFGIEPSYLELSALRVALQNIKARTRVVFLDVCFSGSASLRALTDLNSR